MSPVQRPNYRNHIALAYDTFHHEIIQNDEALKDLLSLSKENNFNLNFTYAIYTDQSFIPSNLFLPVFHIHYLNSDLKYVILRSSSLYDLPMVYKHHKYLLYGDKNKTLQDFELLKKNYPETQFQQISSIKELYEA